MPGGVPAAFRLIDVNYVRLATTVLTGLPCGERVITMPPEMGDHDGVARTGSRRP